ncbi:MAG: alpha/beta hydrolase [Gammaproteobacteria bacterium]
MNFQTVPVWLSRSWASFSFVGLVLAALFFAGSLSPSLIPRNYLTQGLLSGVASIAGYGIGVLLVWTWRYLQLPELHGTILRVARLVLTLAAALTVGFFLWRMTVWQNSIRAVMDMEPVTNAHPWAVGAIAVVLAIALVVSIRFPIWVGVRVAALLGRHVPERLSIVLSTLIVGIVLVSLIDGVLIRMAVRLADEFFEELDELVDEGIKQPKNPLASGSGESLIDWSTIGRRGKNFIVTGPSQAELSEFAGQENPRPLRIYVGKRSAETPEQRAKLALDELKRVDAFKRSVLVVATPTGTGWLDPAAVDTLEYLHAGDTAIVSTQYSYLPSWITLLVDPDRSRTAARALFNAIYAYWVTLPSDDRPRLYLHGLSLGALGSEASIPLFLAFRDPIHGAVWSGPPFPSSVWSAVTRARDLQSPAWLPRLEDGSTVRFTAQKNALEIPGAEWGQVRIVYIQHASDPMTFFSTDLLFKNPSWLSGQRGPDVSTYFEWYPVISFLQVGFDLILATSVPLGYGHNYAPSSYIDAWVEVTQPNDWTAEDTVRLKHHFRK